MKTNTNALFAPITINTLHLKNRIVMAPMTRQYSPGNIPNDFVVNYYKNRAKGGVGLIITEGTCVGHKAANGYENVPYIYGKDALTGWKKVVEAVHGEGGRIMPQLWHVGSVRKLGQEPDPNVPGFGPSGLTSPGKKRCETMTEQDIEDVIAAFAQAAKDAKEIGFDGIEIHGAHGYLIDQFFWEGTNERTDKWGGSLANRSRFAIEVIKAIRAAVGKDFPILFRWSQWKQQDYTAKLVTTPAELERFIIPLSEAGVDVFHCSTRRFWEPEFEGSTLNLAGWVKKITGKPTITVGSVGLDGDFIDEDTKSFRDSQPTNLDGLLERLNADEFDMVAVGRALIANPNWSDLIKNGLFEDIKPYTKDLLVRLD